MKRIMALGVLFATSAFAVPAQTVKIGRDRNHVWWTLNCLGPVCQAVSIVQPQTEAGADLLDTLDGSKNYDCSIRGRTQVMQAGNGWINLLLSYAISDCAAE